MWRFTNEDITDCRYDFSHSNYWSRMWVGRIPRSKRMNISLTRIWEGKYYTLLQRTESLEKMNELLSAEVVRLTEENKQMKDSA